VLIIQTLDKTILFLGVPPAQSPVFFAAVVIVVVILQSPRLRKWIRDITRPRAPRPTDTPSDPRTGPASAAPLATSNKAEVAS
jgi:simple sugar transport system permease protein